MSDQNNGQSRDEQRTRFNPNEHLLQIRAGGRGEAKDYLPVQWRLVWFRELCPQGTIETEMVHLDPDRETEEEYYGYNSETRRNEKMIRRANGFVIFRAVVKDGKGGIATGTKSEKAASFPDYIEKAETGAIGRALAALGFGTQFAPELDEEHRIVDAPVDRSSSQSAPSAPAESNGRRSVASTRSAGANGSALKNGASSPRAETVDADSSATEQQLVSIRKLCDNLGKAAPREPEALTYGEARELIQQLSREYRERNVSRKAS